MHECTLFSEMHECTLFSEMNECTLFSHQKKICFHLGKTLYNNHKICKYMYPLPQVLKIYNRGNARTTRTTLQMKGRWESNINVWFRFMYSLKFNCAALSFPKQNYNILSPNFTFMYLWAIYIFPQSEDRSWEYINRSQIHERGNCEQSRTVSFLGIYVSNFRYSAWRQQPFSLT